MPTIEEVSKSIKEAVDAIKSAQCDNEVRIKSLVEETLKSIIQNHPGFTPQRKIEFGNNEVIETPNDAFASLPKEVQNEADKIYLLSSILKVEPKRLKSYKNFRHMFVSKGMDLAKALDSTTSGGVDEWVPTQMSPNLIEKVRLQLKVAALFPSIQMPSNPYELPTEVGNVESFLMSENTADTGQTPIPVGDTGNISGKVTFTAKSHATRVLMSKEASEDSIVPLLPLIQNRIVLALAQGREDAILNGDTAGSHEDTDISSSTARRKLWLGLRAHSNDQSYTRDVATLTEDVLLDMRGDMGIYGANPADVAWIVGFKGAIALMKIDAFKTLDKIGPRATVLQGQIGELLGSPVVLSEYIRQDLNSSAVYQNGENKTVIHCVHRNGFAVGERSGATTQLLTELYAHNNQNALITTERVDFQPLYAIASNRVVNTGINLG